MRGVDAKMAALRDQIVDGELQLDVEPAPERNTLIVTAVPQWTRLVGGARGVGRARRRPRRAAPDGGDVRHRQVWPERPLHVGVQNLGIHLLTRWARRLSPGSRAARVRRPDRADPGRRPVGRAARHQGPVDRRRDPGPDVAPTAPRAGDRDRLVHVAAAGDGLRPRPARRRARADGRRHGSRNDDADDGRATVDATLAPVAAGPPVSTHRPEAVDVPAVPPPAEPVKEAP